MIAKTKFQAAVAAFVRRVADEAVGTLGPNGTAVIASVVEAHDSPAVLQRGLPQGRRGIRRAVGEVEIGLGNPLGRR